MKRKTINVHGSQLTITRTSFLGKLRRNWILLLMLLPATAFVLTFSYWPMSGIILAFKNYKTRLGIYNSPWCGMDNFLFLRISGKLWPLTRNTLLYNLAFILLGTILEMGFAIILNEIIGKKVKKVAQSAMFLPYFISWVVAGAILYNFFNFEHGLVNVIIRNAGGQPLDIYNNAKYWPYLLIALRAWKQTGYGTVVYLAAITSLDQQMFEAAAIDGANIWKRIRYITIPSLLPTMMVLLLLAIGNIFRGDFGLFYQTMGSGTNANILAATDILDTFVFRSLQVNGDIGMSAAAGFYQSVLCFTTIMLANFAVKKVQSDYALF